VQAELNFAPARRRDHLGSILRWARTYGEAAAGGDKIIDGAQAVDRCFRRVASCQLDDRRIAPAVGLPRRSANSECRRLLGRDVERGHRRGIDKAARNEAGGRGGPVGRRRHRQIHSSESRLRALFRGTSHAIASSLLKQWQADGIHGL
jgi:hypothetical protein